VVSSRSHRVVPPIAESRAADPVVVAGSLVPSLKGVPVGDIVAFRWSSRWVQVPVQVDQRKLVELNTVYGQPANTTNPVKVIAHWSYDHDDEAQPDAEGSP
jgi:hypothetical protein